MSLRTPGDLWIENEKLKLAVKHQNEQVMVSLEIQQELRSEIERLTRDRDSKVISISNLLENRRELNERLVRELAEIEKRDAIIARVSGHLDTILVRKDSRAFADAVYLAGILSGESESESE